MSLWVCPEHGLYGGQVFCPLCGKNGEFVTLAPASIETVTIAASGTDARQRQDRETELGPKGDGPVPKADAQP